MDGRKRTVQIKFRVTEAERDLILEKMKLVPTRNMAAYLRKIAIDGYIIQVDHEAAAKALKTAGITKLPNPATLQKEYEALQAQKEALYADYGKLKKKVREYDVIKQNIDSILQTGKQLADRGLFLLRQLLCGKFLKSCGQHVSVAPFEKHKVAGRAFRRVLFQRKVDINDVLLQAQYLPDGNQYSGRHRYHTGEPQPAFRTNHGCLRHRNG